MDGDAEDESRSERSIVQSSGQQQQNDRQRLDRQCQAQQDRGRPPALLRHGHGREQHQCQQQGGGLPISQCGTAGRQDEQQHRPEGFEASRRQIEPDCVPDGIGQGADGNQAPENVAPGLAQDGEGRIEHGEAGQVEKAVDGASEDIAAGPPAQGRLTIISHDAAGAGVAPDKDQDDKVEDRPDDDTGACQKLAPGRMTKRVHQAPCRHLLMARQCPSSDVLRCSFDQSLEPALGKAPVRATRWNGFVRSRS